MSFDRRLTIGIVFAVAMQSAGVLLRAGAVAERLETLEERVREGRPAAERLARWIRRGREIADSWSFPEAPNEGRFAAEFDTGSGFGGRIEVDEPSCAVPPGTLAHRVAEIGPDGRTGPWLSIAPGSPYL